LLLLLISTVYYDIVDDIDERAFKKQKIEKKDKV